MPEPLDPQCILRVLTEHEVAYVLIGGLAAVLHGSTAMTNDADIVPDPAPENLRRLAAALRDLGARVRSESTPEGIAFDPHEELLASVSVLNLTTRCGDLDVAVTPAGLEGYAAVAANSTTFVIDDVEVPVAALADIIRSKEVADRPKDRATLPILYALERELAGEEE